jgi:hypothetical protein
VTLLGRLRGAGVATTVVSASRTCADVIAAAGLAVCDTGLASTSWSRLACCNPALCRPGQVRPSLVRPAWRTVNITPAERLGRLAVGLAAIIAGIVLLADAGSALAVVLRCCSSRPGWTWR